MPKSKLSPVFVPEAEQPYKIPHNWRWVRLGGITDVVGGGTPSTKEKAYYDNGDIPWISPADLSGYADMYIAHGAKSITRLGLEKSSAQLLPAETVCLSTRAPIGYVAIAKNPLSTNQGFKSFLPSPSYLPRYLYWYLKGNKDLLESRASGTTFLELSGRKAANIEFPLPPLAEQQRIVERIESLFTKLDAAREKAQAVVDGFELRKAALLYRAFSGELTRQWRKIHRIGLNSWRVQKLSETTIMIIDGDRGKNYPKKDDFSKNGYCIFLNAKNVTKNGFVFDQCEYITKEKDESLRSGRLERGDMIMTTRGTIGNIAIYDNSVPYNHLRINSGMVIYRGGEEFIKPYLIWLYQSKLIENQIHSLQTGSAQPQLPIKVMKRLSLPIPTIPEQEAIVNKLNSLIIKERQAKETAECVITQIDAMKKAILGRAFRGELGTNDPSEAGAEFAVTVR